MSMPIAEAIKRIRNHIEVHRIGQYPHIHIGEALTMAIAALQEKAEREDPKPLTIEQLRQMRGEPVWMKEEQAWGIINIDDYGEWKGVPFITFYYKTTRCDWNIVKRGLTCYRHKPKEEETK